MHIADHYDLALQHFNINKKIDQLADDDQLNEIDELVAKLRSIEIEIEKNSIEECLKFAENKQILIEKMKIFENNLKIMNKNFLKEKNLASYEQYRPLQINITSKIDFISKTEILVEGDF
jgi:hypothetical protein